MTRERWQQVKALLQPALEREPDQRTAFLAEACVGDQSLLVEVESLLANKELASRFIETCTTARTTVIFADGQSPSGERAMKYCPKCKRTYPEAKRFCTRDSSL